MEKLRRKNKLIAPLLALTVLVTSILTAGCQPDETVLLRVNNFNVSAGIFKMYVWQSAAQLREEVFGEDEEEYLDQRLEFWATPIDGRLPVDIVKDMALEKVQLHSFFLEQVRRNNMVMRGTDLQMFTSIVESDLSRSGIDTMELFSVSREDYIDFFVYIETFDRLVVLETARQNITEEVYRNRAEGVVRANPERYRVQIVNEERFNEIGLPGIFVFE